ncbi:MAG: pyridoxamine 5'-phosphate oxidase family protein [Pseudaminobacter sp.]
MLIREMNRTDCIDLISSGRVARLACVKDTQPYVIPIYFAFSDNCLYSFSMPGRKIDWMRANPSVCVQMDEPRGHREWRSVIVDGLYEELPDTNEWRARRIQAWSLLSRHANWWEPGGLKPGPQEIKSRSPHLYYRIRIVTISGRHALEDDLERSIGVGDQSASHSFLRRGMGRLLKLRGRS